MQFRDVENADLRPNNHAKCNSIPAATAAQKWASMLALHAPLGWCFIQPTIHPATVFSQPQCCPQCLRALCNAARRQGTPRALPSSPSPAVAYMMLPLSGILAQEITQYTVSPGPCHTALFASQICQAFRQAQLQAQIHACPASLGGTGGSRGVQQSQSRSVQHTVSGSCKLAGCVAEDQKLLAPTRWMLQ